MGDVENISIDFNDTKAVSHAKDSLAYVHFIIGTYIFIVNTLVILAVATHDYLRIRANIYIVSLAGTDLIVGMVLWVVGLHNHHKSAPWFDKTGSACVAMFAVGFFSVDCSMFNMVLIALDRLLYIMKPFFYKRVVTSKKVKMAVASVWLLALAWASVPVFANTYDEVHAQCTFQAAIPAWFRSYSNIPILFIGAVSTGIMYMAISLTAIQHRNAIYKSIPGLAKTSGPSTDHSDAAKKALLSMRSNFKTLKLFYIVFGLLVVCWLPYYFIEFSSELIEIPDSVYRASAALGFLNSGINFFVYPLYNKKFRRAMTQMLCPCCKATRSADNNTYISSTTSNRSGGTPRPVLGTLAPSPAPAAPVLGKIAPAAPEPVPTLAASAASDIPAASPVVLTGTGGVLASELESSVDKPKLYKGKPAGVSGITLTTPAATPLPGTELPLYSTTLKTGSSTDLGLTMSSNISPDSSSMSSYSNYSSSSNS